MGPTNILDLESFHRDGYLVVENFLSESQTRQLKSRADDLVAQFKPQDHPVTRFATKNDKQEFPKYFLDSWDKISYFYEAEAIDEEGKLAVPKERALNKIGHGIDLGKDGFIIGLHLQDKVFRTFTHSQPIVDLLRQLEFQHPSILQSMIIFKVNSSFLTLQDSQNPKIGGKVVPHQDSTFLYTEPVSAIGFWFALDDCTAENGTLAFIPGSHKSSLPRRFNPIFVEYPIIRRMVRNENNDETCFEGAEYTFDQKDFCHLTIPKGSLVIIHGSVVHQSGPNLSVNPRNAYTFHVIEGDYKYDKRNWLQPTTCFDRVY